MEDLITKTDARIVIQDLELLLRIRIINLDESSYGDSAQNNGHN